MVENEKYYPIQIHTSNPVGRANMERMIDRFWKLFLPEEEVWKIIKKSRKEMCVLKQTYKYEKIVLNFENLDYIIIPFEYIEQFSFERIVQKNHVSPTNETLCY